MSPTFFVSKMGMNTDGWEGVGGMHKKDPHQPQRVRTARYTVHQGFSPDPPKQCKPGSWHRINRPGQLGLGPPWVPVVKTLPSNAGGAGSVPVPAAKIPHGLWSTKQNIKQKQYCNKLNKDKKWSTSKKKKKEKRTIRFIIYC